MPDAPSENPVADLIELIVRDSDQAWINDPANILMVTVLLTMGLVILLLVRRSFPNAKPVIGARILAQRLVQRFPSWPWAGIEKFTVLIFGMGSSAIFAYGFNSLVTILCVVLLLAAAMFAMSLHGQAQTNKDYGFENQFLRLPKRSKTEQIREEVSRHINRNDKVRVTFWGLRRDLRGTALAYQAVARQSLDESVVEVGWPEMKLTYGVCGHGHKGNFDWTMPLCENDKDTEFKHCNERFGISREEFDALTLMARTISVRQIRIEPTLAGLVVVESRCREHEQDVIELAHAIMDDPKLLFRVNVFSLLHLGRESNEYRERFEQWQGLILP